MKTRLKIKKLSSGSSTIKLLLIFVVAFSLIGGAYMAWRSFATTPGQAVAVTLLNKTGLTELYTVDSARQLHKITNSKFDYVYNADLSEDGNKIVFSAGMADGSSRVAIFSINANGTNIKQLTSPTKSNPDYQPVWSNDATKVAFYRTTSAGLQLYTINASGSGAHKVYLANASTVDYRWSPSGRRLFVLLRRPLQVSGNKAVIFTINLETGQKTIIASTTETNVHYTLDEWSPSSKSVLYSSSRYDPNTKTTKQSLHTVHYDGTSDRKLTSAASPGTDNAVYTDNAGSVTFVKSDRTGISKINLSNNQITPIVNSNWNPGYANSIFNLHYSRSSQVLVVRNRTTSMNSIVKGQISFFNTSGIFQGNALWSNSYSIYGIEI